MKTYKGSCHCKAAGFEADIDLSAGTHKCNCSICVKTRHWVAIIRPSAFRLLRGKQDLSDYQFGSKGEHHLFCRHCGVRSFQRIYVERMGGEHVAVQVAALDDVDPKELIAASLDEARDRATQFGIVDQREGVVSHWEEAKSWILPPVVVGGDLLDGGSGYELLVGYTRLGNLLGMLDREEVKEAQTHLVWVGRGIHS
jgi:hypothetical protein